MKHILNNAAQGTDLPWVTLDENGVHYPTVIEVSFTFGSVDSHTKAKADAVVGDICYYGETPIGVVVIKEEDKVKIMSLFDLKEDGTNSPDISVSYFNWGVVGTETGITDENDGKSNTTALVALGSDYKAAIACSLYSTEGTSKGDWYLPSKQEISNMYFINKDAIQVSLNSLGSFAMPINEYTGIWTSTEYNNALTYYLNTMQNKILTFLKNSNNLTRAFCEL